MCDELDKRRLITIIASLNTCALLEIEKFMPSLAHHSAIARAVAKVEDAITSLVRLNRGFVTQLDLDIGVKAHNEAMRVLNTELLTGLGELHDTKV